MSDENHQKLVVRKRTPPKSLQSYSLRRVSQMLCNLNSSNIDVSFLWLRKEHNPFMGIPNNIVEEIIEDVSELLAGPVQKEIFQILMCKPLKKIDFTSYKVEENDVLPVLKTIAATQPRLTWFDDGAWNAEDELIAWSNVPLALNYLKAHITSMPSLTYLNVSCTCDDEMLEIIGASCPNLNILIANSEKITSGGLRSLCINSKHAGDQPKRCQKLEEIILNSAEHLMEGVKTLLLYLPRLRLLEWHPEHLGTALIELFEEANELPRFHLHEFTYIGSCPYPLLPSVIAKTCPYLIILNLMDPTKEDLQRFERMEYLRNVWMSRLDVPGSFNEGVATFLRRVGKSLYDLILSDFSDIDFSVISEKCSNLTTLQIVTQNEMSVRVPATYPVFKNLEYLYLNSDQGSGLQPSDCVRLLSRCFNLRSMYINCCPDLKQEHLQEILVRNPLTKLTDAELESEFLYLKGALSEWEEVCSFATF